MDKIQEILTRGVANIIPGEEELEKALKSDKKLNIYLGIDPTAPRIHLGHAVPLRKLQSLAELGHHVTLLIGDFTALVGDTSDKDSERPILTDEEIKENFQTYKKQAEKIVDFSKVHIKHNSEWLRKLPFDELIKLTRRFSVNDFITRELIRKRLDEGKHIRLDEVLYPVMQGYDSYFLDTDVQLGATDQTFNMQAGRTLQKVLRNKESFIITNVFLEGTDGRKMSKSWGNAIWLDDTSDDMFAKVMAINDDLIIQYFTIATNVEMNEINEIKTKFLEFDRMYLKKKLAHTIVSELHNKNDADKAQVYFEKTVQQKELPHEIIELHIKDHFSILETLLRGDLAESKSDAKRLIEQGGVTLNDEKITNPDSPISEGILRVGKRRFAKVTFEK